MSKVSIFQGKPITYEITNDDQINFIVDDDTVVDTQPIDEVVQCFINERYYK